MMRKRAQALGRGCNIASPSTAGEVLCFKWADTVHNVASESYGFSCVARLPGNKVGINIGYYCAVRMRMISIAMSGEGASGPPLSTVVLATTTPNERRKLEKGVPEVMPNF